MDGQEKIGDKSVARRSFIKSTAAGAAGQYRVQDRRGGKDSRPGSQHRNAGLSRDAVTNREPADAV